MKKILVGLGALFASLSLIFWQVEIPQELLDTLVNSLDSVINSIISIANLFTE